MKQGIVAVALAVWPVASNADVDLSAYICNLGRLEMFVVAKTDEGTVLVGAPGAQILEGALETTFVMPGRVIQIGDGAAAELRFGRAFEGACSDASGYIAELVTWLGEQRGTISLPVFDFETTAVLDEADRAIRRALTDAIRRADISEEFTTSLIARMQSSGGMGDPEFPDLVSGVLEVIIADESQACAVGDGSLDLTTFDLENATAAIEGARLDPQLKQQLLTAMTAAQHSPILLLQVLDRVCIALAG
jgi:hypothetical protein